MRRFQERLGHTDIRFTFHTYSHVLPDIQEEAVQKLDRVFARKNPGMKQIRRSKLPIRTVSHQKHLMVKSICYKIATVKAASKFRRLPGNQTWKLLQLRPAYIA